MFITNEMYPTFLTLVFWLQETGVVIKARLMKFNPGINDSKQTVIKNTSNGLFLFEDDFIEIDIPLNEMTIR